MDELLAAMLKVLISLEEFDNQLYGTCKSLQGEINCMRKEFAPVKDVEAVSRDIAALETFHAVSVTQLRGYLEEKVNLFKTYLNEE